MSEGNRNLTKKDVFRSFCIWQTIADSSSSYERKQAVSLTSALGGILQKLYAGNPEGLKRALKRHMNFFNTEGNWGGLIVGATIAMEEVMVDMPDDEKDDAINSFKTGMMGPIAGFGDTVDWGTLKPIILGIGVSIALSGNFLGFLVCMLFNLLILAEGYACWMLGYNKGKSAIGEVLQGGLMQKMIFAASMLGMFMMGSLTASYVELSTPFAFSTGDSTLALQGLLDGLIPGLLPLSAVLVVYFILRNKTQKFGLIALGVVAVSMVGSFFGIF